MVRRAVVLETSFVLKHLFFSLLRSPIGGCRMQVHVSLPGDNRLGAARRGRLSMME